MFTFLGKTKSSIAFREKVDMYIINQAEIDAGSTVEPMYIDYKDHAVFDSKIIINQAQIDARNEEIATMNPEDAENVEGIEPLYQDVLTYTNYFGHLTSYSGKEFQTACATYLASL